MNLKDCPFCGSKVEIYHGKGFSLIQCGGINCLEYVEISAEFDDFEEVDDCDAYVAQQWNTRAMTDYTEGFEAGKIFAKLEAQA